MMALPWVGRPLDSQFHHCFSKPKIPYSGKLSKKKLSRIGEKYDFCGENFRRLLTSAVPKDATSPNFVEKTFANNHKTAKFAKVFSLESFPLYCTPRVAVLSFLW